MKLLPGDVILKYKFTQNENSVIHLHAGGSRVKFHSPQNISGTSQQNTVTALS